MNVRGELNAVFNDDTRRRLFFKGFVEADETGMTDVEVETVFNGDGQYIDFDNIYGFEIISYVPEENERE